MLELDFMMKLILSIRISFSVLRFRLSIRCLDEIVFVYIYLVLVLDFFIEFGYFVDLAHFYLIFLVRYNLLVSFYSVVGMSSILVV